MSRKVIDFGRIGLDDPPLEVEVVGRSAPRPYRIEFYVVELDRDGAEWRAHVRTARSAVVKSGATREAAFAAALAALDRINGEGRG